MTDIENIIKAWERCEECRTHPVGMSQAYLDCEYTIGLYCGQDKLVRHTLDVLKSIQKVVRCKDCKYYDDINGCMSWHDVNSGNDNWFCADGERKEGR